MPLQWVIQEDISMYLFGVEVSSLGVHQLTQKGLSGCFGKSGLIEDVPAYCRGVGQDGLKQPNPNYLMIP